MIGRGRAEGGFLRKGKGDGCYCPNRTPAPFHVLLWAFSWLGLALRCRYDVSRVPEVPVSRALIRWAGGMRWDDFYDFFCGLLVVCSV